jgi:hypothetical protein
VRGRKGRKRGGTDGVGEEEAVEETCTSGIEANVRYAQRESGQQERDAERGEQDEP